MFGVAPRSSRTSLNVPVSSGLSANTRHTSPPLMTGRSLPKRAVSASTACSKPACRRGCGRRNRNDRRRHDGRLVQRRGKGRICAGTGGWRQVSAGPLGASGTRPGGTGGGPGTSGRRPRRVSESTTARQRRERPAGPPVFPETIAPWVMAMLFTENAANSSPRMAGSGRAPRSLWEHHCCRWSIPAWACLEHKPCMRNGRNNSGVAARGDYL